MRNFFTFWISSPLPLEAILVCSLPLEVTTARVEDMPMSNTFRRAEQKILQGWALVFVYVTALLSIMLSIILITSFVFYNVLQFSKTSAYTYNCPIVKGRQRIYSLWHLGRLCMSELPSCERQVQENPDLRLLSLPIKCYAIFYFYFIRYIIIILWVIFNVKYYTSNLYWLIHNLALTCL